MAQVQVGNQGVQVGGEGVVVIAGGRLAGLPEAAAVVGDDPVPGLQQDAFLLLPGVSVERVAVDQHDRLPGAVVFVVDLDVFAVLPADSDLSHCLAFLLAGTELAGTELACPVARVLQPLVWNDAGRRDRLRLGIEARSRALLSEGEAAEGCYREIHRLGRTQLRPELARATCSTANGSAVRGAAPTPVPSCGPRTCWARRPLWDAASRPTLNQ